ncbi:hypothetical protein [Methanoregula sp.]|uniref:hypothetical protein n=1 Tax=Methanoregula sp. TaxID=2052170 RepID=UPI002CECB7D1|nr:hypothetical protein [Methanoregula sp.]HVP95707.1 hypothetical protein [Methanoregula sp.]
MAKKGQGRIMPPSLPVQEMVALLSAAIENRDDFVLAWEPRPGDTPDPGTEPVIHIMTGNLITPCRLNGLKGRVIVYEDEGARVVTFRERDMHTGREK